MKLKVNEKQYIDLDTCEYVDSYWTHDDIKIYKNKNGKFYKYVPADYNHDGMPSITEVNESFVYDVIIKNDYNADSINKKIQKFLPDWTLLTDIQDEE